MDVVKNIPLKNYILLFIILLLSIFGALYFYLWHSAYQEARINTPFIDDYLEVIQFNELDNYLVENKEAIIYVSVLNDYEIRKFENKFKRFINKYSLNNAILYMDITNDLSNNISHKIINDNYGLNFPYIIVFNNGSVQYIFNIKDNNYDIEAVKKFLVEKGVIND